MSALVSSSSQPLIRRRLFPIHASTRPRLAEPRLRICMLAACPFPANHGTPGSIREMSEAVVERGHEVDIVTYHIGENIPVDGPRIHRITPWTNESAVVVGPTVRRPLYDLQMVFKTLQVIRDRQPDLLHAHGYEAALVAQLCRMITPIPVVYSAHYTMGEELASYGFIRPNWVAQGLARLLDAFVPRIANRCVPHSVNIQQFLHGMGLKHRTEPVLPLGIDLERMENGEGASVRRRLHLEDRSVILYAGVLDQFQRIDLLLDAVKTAVAREPSALLLMVTTIPHAGHERRIRRRAEELGISDHVILTEPQPLERIPDFLASCDVAVVPRPSAHGFPIKLLNYMAARCPCVIFASSTSTGLVHRKNVFLAAPDTGQALGAGILEVLRDPTLSRRLGRKGHEFVYEHHDRRVLAERICATYLRTLAECGKSKR